MEEVLKKEIKIKILDSIEKTKLEIIDYKELTKPISPENALGRISRMDAINNKTVNEAALRKAKIRLKNLEIALGRLGSKDFGLCMRCKTTIPLGRILLIPQSKFCIRCAK
jgi:DnaK suppressor protein